MVAQRPRRQRAVVTFLDVLGWKGIYSREEAPIEKLDRILHELAELNAKLIRGRGASSLETRVLSISDTIVFFTPCDEVETTTVIDVHGKLCAQALSHGMVGGLPMRGATAYGEAQVSSNGSVFVGRAVDEAASWHEQGDWFGVFLAPSALFAMAGSDVPGWIEYAPPLHGTTKFSTRCVVWERDALSLQRMFVQLSPILPDVIRKYTNTLDFVNHVNKPAQ